MPRATALSLALSPASSHRVRPSAASAPGLGGSRQGCLRPLRAGSKLVLHITLPRAASEGPVNRAGQGAGRAAPSPRSRTAVLGPGHPAHRAADPSLVLPWGGPGGHTGRGWGSVPPAGEARRARAWAVTVPACAAGSRRCRRASVHGSTHPVPGWHVRHRVTLPGVRVGEGRVGGAASTTVARACRRCHGFGRDRDAARVPTSGDLPPWRGPCRLTRCVPPQATLHCVGRHRGPVCWATCPRPRGE